MQVFISRSRNLVETGYPREEHEAYYYFKKNLTFPLSLSLYRYHPIIHRYHFYRRKLYTMYALVQLFREKNFFFHSSSKIHDQSLIKLDINDPKRFS